MTQSESCLAQASPFSQTGDLCRWKAFEEMHDTNSTNTTGAMSGEGAGVCKYQPQQLSFEVRQLIFALPFIP
jgi:hypothetical protein